MLNEEEISQLETLYRDTTNGIQISVWPQYDSHNSNPNQNLHIYVYTVEVKNLSQQTQQVLSRHWIIKDAFGKVQEVKGSGLVGKQPTLNPGDKFLYSSFCPLETPSGSMEGNFEIQSVGQKKYLAKISPFHLQSKELLN